MKPKKPIQNCCRLDRLLCCFIIIKGTERHEKSTARQVIIWTKFVFVFVNAENVAKIVNLLLYNSVITKIVGTAGHSDSFCVCPTLFGRVSDQMSDVSSGTEKKLNCRRKCRKREGKTS